MDDPDKLCTGQRRTVERGDHIVQGFIRRLAPHVHYRVLLTKGETRRHGSWSPYRWNWPSPLRIPSSNPHEA